jgi:glycosyltransferase involved in cell wall biosynthesis
MSAHLQWLYLYHQKTLVLKIAILTDGIYPYVIGGMQKHSFYLSKFLAQEGVAVTLVHCVAYNEDIPSEEDVRLAMELPEEVRLESICLRFPKADWMPGHYLKESFIFSVNVFKSIKDRLAEFDFIYAKGFAAWKLLDAKKKGLTCAPISVKFHGYEMFQPAPSFKVKLEHLMLRGPVKFNNLSADWVFSYGGRISPIIKSIGVAEKRIIEIPTGIESNWCLDKPIQIEGKRSILFIGRYERRKGVEELNTVLQAILQTHDFDMHFIGPIPPSKKIQAENVTYHGKVMAKAAIQEIMKACDVLVTPSHSEGMPNVIMEGMARGMAVIATDVGAVGLQVDELNGWLISPADIPQLKKAMIEAIELDNDKLLTKRKGSIDKIKSQFTWEAVARQTKQELTQIINP